MTTNHLEPCPTCGQPPPPPPRYRELTFICQTSDTETPAHAIADEIIDGYSWWYPPEEIDDDGHGFTYIPTMILVDINEDVPQVWSRGRRMFQFTVVTNDLHYPQDWFVNRMRQAFSGKVQRPTPFGHPIDVALLIRIWAGRDTLMNGPRFEQLDFIARMDAGQSFARAST